LYDLSKIKFYKVWIGEPSVKAQNEKHDSYRIDNKPKTLIRKLYNEVRKQRESHGGKYGNIAAIRMDCDSEYADVARYIEALWFKDWYQDQTSEQFAKSMHQEYGPYERASRFIVLMDMDEKDEDGLPWLVGMARAVGGRAELLKTVNDMPEVWGVHQEDILEDIKKCSSRTCADHSVGDPAGTWDYSSMAVAKKYRGTPAYAILSHELYRWSKELGIHTAITIFVVRLFEIYKSHGVPFRVIAGVEPKVHMEELSVPAVLHFPEAEQMAKSWSIRKRLTWRYMAEGKKFNHFRAAV
jgi:hypothetical protein